MKDAESCGDVWFHLVDCFIMVLLLLSDGFSIIVELGAQCYGNAKNGLQIVNIG